MSGRIIILLTAWLGVASVHSEPVVQIPVPTTERMPALPSPLAVRNWNQVSRAYYKDVFDPKKQGEGIPAVFVDGDGPFRMKSYLKHQPDTRGSPACPPSWAQSFVALIPETSTASIF